MEIQFYGANCISVTVGGARLVIDDTIADMGGKPVTKSGDVALYTRAHGAAPDGVKLVIDRAGEYEVSDVSVYGIQAKAHIDDDKQKTAVMYKLIAKDIRLLVAGHISSKLKESDLEAIGTIDVLVVPVGGNGYTLDPVGAMELIKEVEPKIVVPTHYADDKLSFEVPAQTLEQALQAIGSEPTRTSKLKLKHADLPTDGTFQVVVIEKN